MRPSRLLLVACCKKMYDVNPVEVTFFKEVDGGTFQKRIIVRCHNQIEKRHQGAMDRSWKRALGGLPKAPPDFVIVATTEPNLALHLQKVKNFRKLKMTGQVLSGGPQRI